MASTRAAEVAEVLWELKKAGKVAMYSAIARRAGFSAGANGRAMKTCIRTIRRDWPHLQWWRAVMDDRTVKPGGEQSARLKELGVEVSEKVRNGRNAVVIQEELLMEWEELPAVVAATADTGDDDAGEDEL